MDKFFSKINHIDKKKKKTHRALAMLFKSFSKSSKKIDIQPENLDCSHLVAVSEVVQTGHSNIPFFITKTHKIEFPYQSK